MHKKTEEQLKQKTMIMSVIAVALVVLGVIVVTQSETLQGWLKLKTTTTPSQLAIQGLKFNGQVYKWGGKFVTPVATQVPTVVASTVVSPAGPSLVASAYATPVASAVPVPASMMAGMNTSNLPVLTAEVLKAAAKLDLATNPSKYQLSKAMRQQLLSNYKNSKKRMVK